MVELVAKSPCDGLLPVEIGEVLLTEIEPGHMTSLAPFNGKADAAATALQKAHGMAWPAPGRATGKARARAIWFGRTHVLLVGPEPAGALGETMAVTDQSDAWAVVRLEGEGAEDVLARLAPVDLRQSVFKRGYTARTELMHMSSSITRLADGAFLIMVFRSMAQTLVHDLKTAMEAVAARD